MIHLTIDTKKCMSELLLRDTFDGFSLINGDITTFSEFQIDGYLHKDFFEEAPDREYGVWADYRNFCFSIIKGKRTPLHFKFVFALSKELVAEIIKDASLDFVLENIQGLYLNFQYDGTTLTCTTGTALKIFTLDKTLEHALDKWTEKFFTDHEIKWEPVL